MQSNKSVFQLTGKLLVILTAVIPFSSSAQAQQHDEPVGKNTAPPESNLINTAPSVNTERSVVSDLLIVLDSDGRSYTAQHTIASNGPTIGVRMPGSVIPQETRVFNSVQNPSETGNALKQNTFSLKDGVGLVRYQHQLGAELAQPAASQFTLTTASPPITVQTERLNRSTITWVFPTDYELVSYTSTNPDIGHWVVVDNTLTFQQITNERVTLSIDYIQTNGVQPTTSSSCTGAIFPSDDCDADKDEDGDGIPDYLDVCKSESDQAVNEYGCSIENSVPLESVVFNTGRTYLNAAARATLDKVAHALINLKKDNIEIAAHTDNEGAAPNNLQLSKKRAEAVRHYLILRGVNPNIITAAGYGEKYPIRENTTADGRRANRRVELIILE